MDVTINVFEFHHSHEQDCDYQYYDSVATAKPIPFPGKDFNPSFHQAYQLDKYLQEKHFDIIHCHLIVAADLLSRKLRSHCDRLFATFWGGEEYRKILGSKKLYRNRLKKFLERIDCLMNSKHLLWLETFPFLREKFKESRLGSASLDIIYDLIKKYPRNEIKAELGFPNDKVTVLIGYSGKSIHQHKEIIRNFSIRPQLRDKFHLLAIMTRGTVPEYAEEVECALTSSGYSYSMIKGHFLSDEQIARFRYGTDITLQLSTYDGFSRSIVECLCAGSIMIYGTWLNYDNRLKQDFVRINQEQKYVAKIRKNEEGEICFNYKYFSGELLGKLINIDKPAWKNRYDLPKKNEYLAYDNLKQKIIFTKKETEKCDNGCYLFVDVHPNENYLTDDKNISEKYMDYSIYLKKSEKIIQLRLNEVIIGTLQKTIEQNYIEYYSIEVPYSTKKLYIDYSSENTNVVINSRNSKPTKDDKDLSFDSTGKDQIYIIEKEDSNLKEQKYIIGIYTYKLSNGVSQYSYLFKNI